MMIPEESEMQPEIKKELFDFIKGKRVIQISQILRKLINTYENRNLIGIYIDRDHELVFSNSREVKENDHEELRKWIVTLLRPEEKHLMRIIKEGFACAEILQIYCRIVGKDYQDHYRSKCGGTNNKKPIIEIEDIYEGEIEEVIMKE